MIYILVKIVSQGIGQTEMIPRLSYDQSKLTSHPEKTNPIDSVNDIQAGPLTTRSTYRKMPKNDLNLEVDINL